jgi:CRISPR-associated protein Cmr1
MRKSPSLQPKVPPRETPAGRIQETRTYKFLTPVFGGGVEVREHIKPPDPVTPIRVASIRGQLRFWWRACNPQGCKNINELREAEGKVFGSTTAQSPLHIQVKVQPGAPIPEAFTANASYQYATFPLRDAKGTNNGTLSKYTASWELQFGYPESIANDVQAALWAWASFGGLGGRTRRGFGAIHQTSNGLLGIDEGWKAYVRHPANVLQWPCFAKDREHSVVVSKQSVPSSEQALNKLIDGLKKMRQRPGKGPGFGRRVGSRFDKKGNRIPGRSYWPEADTIRAYAQSRHPTHGNPLTSVRAFPRAVFGTPIIFEIRNEELSPTLVPTGKKRLASSLIIRPHADPNNMGYIGMAVVLCHPEPSGYSLEGNVQKANVPTQMTREQALEIRTLDGNPDPIQFFLETIR